MVFPIVAPIKSQRAMILANLNLHYSMSGKFWVNLSFSDIAVLEKRIFK
jgi:hypothetical protein